MWAGPVSTVLHKYFILLLDVGTAFLRFSYVKNISSDKFSIIVELNKCHWTAQVNRIMSTSVCLGCHCCGPTV